MLADLLGVPTDTLQWIAILVMLILIGAHIRDGG